MQLWQVKALKLEESALNDLSGFVREHVLFVLVGIICLLLVLLAWVLGGGLRRRFPQQAGRARSVIVIESSPPPDDRNPFPSPNYYSREDNCDPDGWED